MCDDLKLNVICIDNLLKQTVLLVNNISIEI